ncbi:hypothetical protein NFI96_009015 [Prochilodus magdalenae]|nr:hypothetical protein NFI96_009015 [Prochilodus magdalenae]
MGVEDGTEGEGGSSVPSIVGWSQNLAEMLEGDNDVPMPSHYDLRNRADTTTVLEPDIDYRACCDPDVGVTDSPMHKEEVREPESKSGQRLLKKGAVPMLFEGNNFSVPLSRPGVWERRKRPTEDGTPVKEADTLLGDHDYASAPAPDPTAVNLVLEENTLLREEIFQLKQQTEKLTLEHRFGIHRFAGSDSDVLLYTSSNELMIC